MTWNRYPYTDNHELNLDWFLKQFRNLVAAWENLQTVWTNYKNNLDAEWSDVQEAWQTYKTYIDDYFDNLNVQTEINNKIDSMVSSGQFLNIISPTVVVQTTADTSRWLAEHITQETGYVLDTSLTVAGAAADAKATGDAVANLKKDLEDIADGFSILEHYLYAKNRYINSSMAETTLDGYNLYKIPIENLDIVHITWDTVDNFWNTLAVSAVMRFEVSDHSYRSVTQSEAVLYAANKDLMSLAPSDAINFCVCAYADYSNYVTVCKNSPMPTSKTNTVKKMDTVTQLSHDNAIISNAYLQSTNNFAMFSSPYYSFFIKVKNGDRVVWNAPIEGVAFHGMFRKTDGTYSMIPKPSAEYTFDSDGLANLFTNVDTSIITYYPADSIKIAYNNIVDIPPFETNNPYQNLNGVAFGTSLTYRALTTGGFLQYLEPLSEMTFDNQGLGSSTILPVIGQPEMMPKITGYTGYSGKEICLLEGFVNDWYYNPDKLGTWKDSGQATVCGCVRYAINYIWTQNPNLTIFLILDHFGQGITAATAVNNNGQTQFEWWAEIEKVALSMGVRVIREYEISEISEKTPQYLLDNIHLNALGAEQSANAIWATMKQSVPNI